MKSVIEFLSGSKDLESNVGKFITRAVNKSTKVMERNIKINTPVKHGYLRRSITSRMTGETKGEVYTNPVGSIPQKSASKKGVASHKEVSYAVYLEYGTRFIAPRAMFRKGVAQSESTIKDIFRDEARGVLDKVLHKEKK